MPNIKIIGAKKKFRIFHDKTTTLKDKIINFGNRKKYEERWVLRGIDIEVAEGEVIGLIGQNGSGKSTLLKLMSGILIPNEGKVLVEGKVSSLLELGAGFHPDMSGRENIFINASIFGLSRLQIEEKLDSIIEFSEMGYFIDNPVRTYSSGMYMRLAFSIAVHVEADILLIDEILTVGDANFQKKCFERIIKLKDAGTTIAVVSHDLESLKHICTKVYWLHDGVIFRSGNPFEVCNEYLNETGQLRISNERSEGILLNEQHKLELDNLKLNLKILDYSDSLYLPKERATVTVLLSNDSLEAISSLQPYPVHISYHWIDEDEKMVVYEGERTRLATVLLPGSSFVHDMKVQVPVEPGNYYLVITLVQEGCFWFDEANICTRFGVEVKEGD